MCDKANDLALRGRIWKWLKRLALGSFLFVCLGLGFLAYQTSSRTRAAEKANPPKGQLVDVGSHKLHVSIAGDGPTVVMDAAGGDAGTYGWFGVEDSIAKFATVVTYDRSGLGWSELGPTPRTSSQEIEDLRTLLTNCGLSPPYVLVGNSLGGYLARTYACRYPDEVSGLVLVDAFATDPFPDDAPVTERSLLLECLVGLRHIGSATPIYGTFVANASDEIEASRIKSYVEMHCRPSSFGRFFDLQDILEDWREVREKYFKLSIPTTVIFAQRTAKEVDWDWWPGVQASLAENVSDDVELVTVDCGHRVQVEQPAVVVDAVREMLERVEQSHAAIKSSTRPETAQ